MIICSSPLKVIGVNKISLIAIQILLRRSVDKKKTEPNQRPNSRSAINLNRSVVKIKIKAKNIQKTKDRQKSFSHREHKLDDELIEEIYEKANAKLKLARQRNDFRRRSCQCTECGGKNEKLEKTRFLIANNPRFRKTVGNERYTGIRK